jgi:hypothetical protein
MGLKDMFLSVIFYLLIIILAVSVSTAKAADYVEEFEDTKLDPTRWEMKVEGNASFEIRDGDLIMTSPGVADGILLYWIGSEIDKEDFTVEIKATVAPDTNNAAIIAFIRTVLPPTLNTTINAEWKNMFWCGTNTPGWYINNDDWKRAGAQGPEFEGVWKAEIKGDNIICYFNDEEVVTVDKIQDDRYLCFGPDTYTSHYSGAMTIDWIKLSGSSVKSAPVEAAGKFSTSWGRIKNAF